MTATQLMQRYSMQAHVENGAFIERHYEHTTGGRAASGSMYYYVSPKERTEFHQIDCDEYWCYTAGQPLELWLFSPDGALTIQRFGVAEGCEPIVYVPKGTIFASRHAGDGSDGTFLTCITVPRFDYAGFRLLTQEEMMEQLPASKGFWE